MSDMPAWQTPNLDWQSEFAVCQAGEANKKFCFPRKLNREAKVIVIVIIVIIIIVITIFVFMFYLMDHSSCLYHRFLSLADKILEEIASNESAEDATLARKFIAAVKCRTVKPEAITVDLAVKGKWRFMS